MIKNWQDAEKYFESEINSLGKIAFIHQITDTKAVNNFGSNNTFEVKSIVKDVPSDFIITVKGVMFYAEVKYCSSGTSFPFSNFTKGEWRAMKRQLAAGGRYYTFIYSRVHKKWYVLKAQQVLNTDKKSLKWEEIQEWNLKGIYNIGLI